jgi:hypothetical protein
MIEGSHPPTLSFRHRDISSRFIKTGTKISTYTASDMISMLRVIRMLHSQFSVSSWLDHSAGDNCRGSDALGYLTHLHCSCIPQVRQASDYARLCLWDHF